MKEGYIIDENGMRITLTIPENALDMTEAYNSSRTVTLLKDQHKEQCKQNRRLFFISIITSAVSIGALVISIIALYQG